MDFSDPTIVMFGKLLLAAFLGILIGTERALFAKQTAGSRTFGLVSMGACLFVIAGAAANAEFMGIVNFDPSRVLAAIVQGIGFLGAGLIIFQAGTLRGVTTAAGLWVAAAVGAVVGLGMFKVAFFAAVLTLLIFYVMWFIERLFKEWFSGDEHTIA